MTASLMIRMFEQMLLLLSDTMGKPLHSVHTVHTSLQMKKKKKRVNKHIESIRNRFV